MAIEIQGMTPLLQVFDMATSLEFYCGVLGFEIVATDKNTAAPNHNWVWLRLDGVDLMLNTAYEYGERPPVPNAGRVAGHDDAALYFGAPDVDAVYAHLLENGIKVNKPKIASYGMKQLWFHDPDGFGLCFQWRASTETDVR
jgi:glyoxylase I family protein